MIDAFVEGARSIVQVCHLVILAPVGMIVVAGKGRWATVGGALLGVVLGGWVFVTRWVVLSDGQLRASGMFVALATVLVGVPLVIGRVRDGWDGSSSSAWTAAGLAAAVAVVVTLWWRPCVGEELGDILTSAPGEPVGQLLPTIGFMLGIAIPILGIGLLYTAVRPSSTSTTRLAYGATAVGVVLALSVVAGQHGEIVARLFEWSQ